MEKEIKRGYVKWTDEDGVFHKEPLADHNDMLVKANPNEQLKAEEASRLNAAAKEQANANASSEEKDAQDTLAALKKAPKDVLTATQLLNSEKIVPASAAEEPVSAPAQAPSNDPIDEQHASELAQLREDTSH